MSIFLELIIIKPSPSHPMRHTFLERSSSFFPFQTTASSSHSFKSLLYPTLCVCLQSLLHRSTCVHSTDLQLCFRSAASWVATHTGALVTPVFTSLAVWSPLLVMLPPRTPPLIPRTCPLLILATPLLILAAPLLMTPRLPLPFRPLLPHQLPALLPRFLPSLQSKLRPVPSRPLPASPQA